MANFFAQLKHLRAIAACGGKTGHNFPAAVYCVSKLVRLIRRRAL
jgi:hypothetical protein